MLIFMIVVLVLNALVSFAGVCVTIKQSNTPATMLGLLLILLDVLGIIFATIKLMQ